MPSCSLPIQHREHSPRTEGYTCTAVRKFWSVDSQVTAKREANKQADKRYEKKPKSTRSRRPDITRKEDRAKGRRSERKKDSGSEQPSLSTCNANEER